VNVRTFLSTFAVLLFFQQSLMAAVTGRVIDAKSAPVKKAMVIYLKLDNRLLWAYSDSLGNFSIPEPPATGVRAQKAGPAQARSIEIIGNSLFFTVNGTKNVTVDLFTAAGKNVARLFNGTLTNTSCTVNPFAAVHRAAHSVYMVRLQIGPDVFCRKMVYAGGRFSSAAGAPRDNTPSPLLKKAAMVDTLRIGKTGYLPAKVPIDIYYKDVGDVRIGAVDLSWKIDSILGLMTLDEKIGQMAMGEFRNLTGTEVKTYMIGSVFSGGGGVPTDNTLTGWQNLFDGFQQQAMSTRLKIPIVYGIDAVHGHSNIIGAVIFPHNIGMGCMQDPALLSLACRATAIEVKSTGLNWTFSPCIAVPRDERWGRTFEGFGETPLESQVYGAAAVEGYQGYDLASPYTITATTKHFVADGGTLWGTGTKNKIDRGDARITDAVLRQIHLPGYIAAIAAGTGTIMPSLSLYNGVNVSGDQALITDILKTELKYDGVVASDWDAAPTLYLGTGYYYNIENIVACVNAGQDMMMIGVAQGLQDFIANGKLAVQQNKIPLSRIDDAVTRILRLKYRLGIFDNPFATRTMNTVFGSSLHRDVARQCVRESMVLLKNDSTALPIPKNANVAVVGVWGDDLGRQCGGWTITWQGLLGNITTGTTLKKAIQNVCTGTVTYSATGDSLGNADYVVVVVGENPYAEGLGDTSDLTLSPAHKALIAKCASSGKKVVCMLFSGRPMIITDVLPNCNAFVAAWLPGTEGEGMADVLFGDNDFTGKLKHTWPSSMTQIPINSGDGKTGLFPYGYGLKMKP
jgi:beta-glucosidase